MNANQETENAIEELVAASCGQLDSDRRRHVLREALLNLVRLAKAEQMLEIRQDVMKLTSVSDNYLSQQRAAHSCITKH